MKKNDLIFPTLLRQTSGNEYRLPYPVELNNPVQNFITTSLGLTKRELFAALAMQSLLKNTELGFDNELEVISQTSVQYADALISELNKEK